jgi:hypothetical protein
MQKLSCRVSVIGGIFASLVGAADVDVKHEPTRIGAWIDAGQIHSGEVDFDAKVKNQVLTRSKVSLTQVATVNQNLTLTGAVGGLFFYSLPAEPSAPHTRLTKFTAVLEEASARFVAGDVEKPWMENKVGLFFEKYNPDAKNLGEYLFRSGTYPGYLQTGGWYIVNNAGYFLQGLRTSLNLLDGKLRPEFLLFMERDWEPTFDLTPAFMLTYKAGSVFEAGAGLAINHLIAAKPSATNPKDRSDRRAAWAVSPTSGKDTLLTTTQINDTLAVPGLNYYTFQGTKVVARASFNPQALIQSELLNPEDLKIYAEMAVLGVKNYPIYYDKIAKRMPIMLGLNLPTFKLLDQMAFEVEYYDSDFPNSLEDVYQRTLPIPGSIGGVGTANRQDYIDSLGTQRKMRDKVKWSFWATKEVTPGFGLTLQVASDHFRPIDFNLKPTYEPVTKNWNDWYYMVRMNFGI